MKTKGVKQEETERTRDQTIAHLLDLAKQASKHIINKDFESATHPLAEELKVFSQEQQHMDFVELIDVYFVLADAYVEKKQLKRAERYLSTGYTVFFKIQEEKIKTSKGILSPENTRHLNALRATLCKMIGKLKKAKGDFEDAIKQFSYSIYLDSVEYGPENYRLTSRYYLLAECLRSQGKVVESRNVLKKVVNIWKDTLCRKICGSAIDDPDDLYTTEAMDNLKNALLVLENELGPVDALVGECEEAIGLIEMVRGNSLIAGEYLQKAVDTLNNAAGQFDRRTEEAQEVLKLV